MIEIQARVDGIADIQKKIAAFGDGSDKAVNRAIRVEGFSLRATMQQAVRMASPAPGVRLRDLSMIARVLNRKSGVRQPKPLLRLAGAITYDVDNAAGTMRVGFTRRTVPWARRAAMLQQAGFMRPVTARMRAYMASRGAERRTSRKWTGRRTGNPLLLRETTTRFTIPPRPIVGPFWDYQKKFSIDRIRSNFRMIMAGKVAPGGVLYSVQEMAGW